MAHVTWSDRLVDDGVAIFLFHGVVEHAERPVRNYTRKHLSGPAFEAIVADLAAVGTPVTMDDVLASCAGRSLPPRSFAITFDDGFRNNLTVAAPILDRWTIPATFYVTTGFVDDNALSWIDRLEHLFERASHIRTTLPWRAAPVEAATGAERRAVLDELRAEVKSRRDLDVEALVRAIHDEHGLDEVTASDDELDRKLTWDEVRDLAAHPRFTVGGHTHLHPILAFLDDAGLQGEIAMSLTRLADAGISTAHYSYPEGLAHCFDDRVIAALKDAGIRCCPTAIDGVNPVASDPFRLRRISVT